MMNAIKTGLAMLSLLALLAGCSLADSTSRAQGSNTDMSTCMAIGSTGGVIPDFQAAQVNSDGFYRYRVWLYANAPCVPIAWLPRGCSITVTHGDTTAFPGGRYPYDYGAQGSYYPDPATHPTFAINSDMGVQAMRCSDGYRVLWWNRVSSSSGSDSFYHEVSTVAPAWSPWHGTRRWSIIPVGVHDPVFHGLFSAWLEQRNGGKTLPLWNITLSQVQS